jgi:hypothetical protein
MEENKDTKKRGNYKPKKTNEIKLALFYDKFKEQKREENGK